MNKDHVIKVNQAEAEFWRRSEGYRVGWSDEILGFDCGGQQWVSEICFPAGTLAKPNMKDIQYIEEVMQLIEKEQVPAPAPIEQRWTTSSKSPMSPAYSSAEDDIFSWVTFTLLQSIWPNLREINQLLVDVQSLHTVKIIDNPGQIPWQKSYSFIYEHNIKHVKTMEFAHFLMPRVFVRVCMYV